RQRLGVRPQPHTGQIGLPVGTARRRRVDPDEPLRVARDGGVAELRPLRRERDGADHEQHGHPGACVSNGHGLSPWSRAKTMAWARDQTPSLSKTFEVWFRTVFSLIVRRSAISVLLNPSVMSA